MIQKIINFIVYTNLWISLAALSCGILTYFLFKKDINPYILAILFGGTLSRYNYIVFSIKKGSISDKFSYMFHKRKAAIIFFFNGLIISGYGFIFLSLRELLFLSHLIIISSLYFTSIKIGRINFKKFRNWPYTKVFIISYVWVGVTFIFPLINNIENSPYLFLAVIERYFFFLGITLPFDVRDKDFDEKTHVKTLATKFGQNITNYIASISLILSAIISFLLYEKYVNFIMSMSYVLFIPLVLMSKTKSSELHFTGLLDGTMILQLLFVVVVLIF